MESVEIKEALQTAIMLGEASQSNHTVNINGIGEVQIDQGFAALMSEAGEWKLITRENLEQRLEELMTESAKVRTKREFETFAFS